MSPPPVMQAFWNTNNRADLLIGIILKACGVAIALVLWMWLSTRRSAGKLAGSIRKPTQYPSLPKTSIARRIARFLRFYLWLNYGACIYEGVTVLSADRPQLKTGFLIVLVSIVALVRSVLFTPFDFLPELAAVGVVALVHTELLMESDGEGSVLMMWVNFMILKSSLYLGFVYVLVNIAVHDTVREMFCAINHVVSTTLIKRITFNPLGWRKSKTFKQAIVIVASTFLMFKWQELRMRPWTNTYKADPRYLPIMAMMDGSSYSEEEHARQYYISQVPLIQESIRKNFILHPYFSHTAVWRGIRLQDLYTERIKTFASQRDEAGATGYQIEKDKCKMLEFFDSNGFRIPKMLGVYRDKSQLIQRLKELKNEGNSIQFPIFLKSCHLTQGSNEGTIPLRSSALTGLDYPESPLRQWIDEKWEQRGSDENRPWTKYINPLLKMLEPGVAIQSSFSGLPISPEDSPLEVKVEVVWGRAYLGLFSDYHDVVALRSDEFQYIDRTEDGFAFWTYKADSDRRLQWLTNGEHNYMNPVWQLAERAAIAIGIDEVRVDIFINPLKPDEPEINEISLSSGHNYFFHAPFLAKAWSGPLLALKRRRNRMHFTTPKENRPGFWAVPRVKNLGEEVWEQNLSVWPVKSGDNLNSDRDSALDVVVGSASIADTS